MRGIILFVVITTFLIIEGCVDTYPLTFPDPEPRLVVDAWLSSELNESYIAIGWTYNPVSPCIQPFLHRREHLRPEEKVSACSPDPIDENHQIEGEVTLSEEGGWRYNFVIKMQNKKGYLALKLDTIKGIPGKKYFIDIEITYQGKAEYYNAETYMNPTPSIDEIIYQPSTYASDEGKPHLLVPLISFEEPAVEKNYYLFRVCPASKFQESTSISCIASGFLPYSVLDDRLLPNHVEQLSIDDGGTTIKYTQRYPVLYDGVGVEVTMWSITEETFSFYKAILMQFNNDGGAYQPTPSTPPGNFNNGALGLFRATQPTKAMVFYP